MANKKLYLSNTSIQTFLHCKRKFKYKYLDKINVFENKSSKHISFGNSIHLALADFNSINDNSFKTLDILHNLLRKNWIRDGYESIEEEREFGLRGLDILSTYYADPQDTGKENLIIEKMIYKDSGDYILCGKLDKVYLKNDNTVEILDYKTGNTISTVDTFQLSIYLLLAKEKLGYYPQSVSLYYLPHNKKIIEYPDEEFLKKSFKNILKICELILKEQNFSCTPNQYCESNCDYYKICDIAQDENLSILHAINNLRYNEVFDHIF